MKQIAAFYWNQKKSEVSYLIIEAKTYAKIEGPKNHVCGNERFEDFCVNANNAIIKFFELIAQQREQGHDVIIRYKTVMPGSKIKFRGRLTKSPEENSTYVHTTLVANAKSRGIEHNRIRSKLKKPELIFFKDTLLGLGLIGNLRDGEFKYHVWSIAVHATKAKCHDIAKEMWNYRQPVLLKGKDANLKFQEWIQRRKSK